MPDSKPTSNRLIFGLVAAALVAAVVFVLRDSAGPDKTQPPGNVLHRGLGTDPETFDAQKSQSVQASIVLRDLGEGLMTYTAGGKLVPGAAEDWSVSDDGLVYTFTLREEGRWSNCDAVTADDFVYTFRRLVDPATAAPRTQSLGIVGNAKQVIAGQSPPTDLGVRAVDPRTLEVTLEQPTPYFLHLLTRPSTFPQNAQNIATHGAQHARPGTLISNGAYTLAAVTPGALIELERNACYHDVESTAIERVHYHVLVEPMSEYNRFRAGELHITSTLPANNFASIREQFPDELRIAPSLGVYYYGFNISRPPFADNPLLREALSMAIDREVLVEKITARGEKPAYSWVPPGLDGYTPPTMTFSKLAKADREERARALYQQAGFSAQNPARFELRYNTHEDHKQIALAVKSMWEDRAGRRGRARQCRVQGPVEPDVRRRDHRGIPLQLERRLP
jgi:oligopeptide transport system substrate-binding protein